MQASFKFGPTSGSRSKSSGHEVSVMALGDTDHLAPSTSTPSCGCGADFGSFP